MENLELDGNRVGWRGHFLISFRLFLLVSSITFHPSSLLYSASFSIYPTPPPLVPSPMISFLVSVFYKFFSWIYKPDYDAFITENNIKQIISFIRLSDDKTDNIFCQFTMFIISYSRYCWQLDVSINNWFSVTVLIPPEVYAVTDNLMSYALLISVSLCYLFRNSLSKVIGNTI